MRVTEGHFEGLVAEQLLDGLNVHLGHGWVRGEGAAWSVEVDVLELGCRIQ